MHKYNCIIFIPSLNDAIDLAVICVYLCYKLKSAKQEERERGKREKRVQISGWWQPPAMRTLPNNNTEVVGTKSWDQRQQNNTWGKYCHSDYGRTVPWHFRGAIVPVKLRDKAVL